MIKKKLTLIYLPFLVVSLSVTIFYSGLFWLLEVVCHLRMNTTITYFLAPACIAALPCFLFLRKRIKLLNIIRQSGKGPFGYLCMATLVMVMPAIFAANFLVARSINIVHVGSVNDIDITRKLRYYDIDGVWLPKFNSLFQPTITISGKSDNIMNYSLFIATPMCTNSNERFSHRVWWGYHYRASMNTRDPEYNDSTEARLLRKWEDEFSRDDNYHPAYYEDMPNDFFRRNIAALIKQHYDVPEDELLILEPHKDAFSNRGKDDLRWWAISFFIGHVAFLLMVSGPRFSLVALEDFEHGKRTWNHKDAS